MKDFRYELIEKLRERQQETDPGAAVLAETEDAEIFCALSPERMNLIEALPWKKEMRVLVLGGGKGIFVPLCERVGELRFEDDDDLEREAVRARAGKKLAENCGNVTVSNRPGGAAPDGEPVFDAVIAAADLRPAVIAAIERRRLPRA